MIKKIVFELRETADKTGEYFAPQVPKWLDTLDDLGFPPETDSWVGPVKGRGYYTNETIGEIVYELVKAGYTVEFEDGRN